MTRPEDHATRVALVTGAGSGIGRATAHRLVQDGWTVACLDIEEQAVLDTVEVVGGDEGNAFAVRCDVRSEEDVAAAVRTVVERTGSIDALVNCAGICGLAHTTQVSLAEWNRFVAINLTGTFMVIRECMEELLRSGGAVVSMSSITGHQGRPYLAAYSATKGGVEALTRALAVEYGGRGVRFNCVAPGSIDTPLRDRLAPPDDADPKILARGTARQALGVATATPAEIAAGVAYLLSADAGFVTGTTLVIDGGATA